MKTVIFIIGVLSLVAPHVAQCTASQSDAGCATCANSHCTECKPYFKFKGTYCLPCGEGFWSASQNVDPECQPCAEAAEKCTSSSILDITYCYPGWYRGNINGCTRCPVGKTSPKRTSATGYETEAVCNIDCSEGVSACKSPDAADIEFCKAGYYKTYGGCLRCPIGKTRTPRTTSSSEELPSNCDLDCAPGASACTGTGASDATHCKEGYFKASAGCTVCPAGKGKAPHSLNGLSPAVETQASCDITCATGIANCQTSSATEGHWCLANYWWAFGVCTPCGEGKFKLAGNGIPTTFESPMSCGNCATGASKCTGPDAQDSIHCMAGYFKLSSGCKMCPTGTGKPAHDVAAAPPASENESNCTSCPDIKNLPVGSMTMNPASCNPTSTTKSNTASLMQFFSGVIFVAFSHL